MLRTTNSICADYDSFVAGGANLKKAKMYNNVIREPFFKNIPIEQVYEKQHAICTCCTHEQVCPPGLHITLGIFYRLFSLLESECHLLDLKITEEDSTDEGGASYANHLRALQKFKNLKDQLDRYKNSFS